DFYCSLYMGSGISVF
nr:immunoglobulin light chain junction region [Macaca mulatta]